MSFVVPFIGSKFGLSLISLADCNNVNARASLAVSFGIAIVAPCGTLQQF